MLVRFKRQEQEGSMTFREKLAWVTLVGIILVYGGHLVSLIEGGNIVVGTNTELIIAMIAFGIVTAIGSIGVSVFTSKADREARDERDEKITLRAERAQGTIITIGAFLVFIYALMTGDRLIAHFLFFWMVAGELAKVLYQITLYRGASA